MRSPDSPPLGLDHVGVAVADLDAARSWFERLGFRLTARSHHVGARAPGAPIEKWGSANHCAMFERGYLEVLGMTDSSLFSSVKSMLALYPGLHIVAADTASADQTYQSLAAVDAPVEAVRPLERDAPFGLQDAQTRRARFRNIYVDRTRMPEARFILIEHLTRDVLWQPHLLAHPNGALGLTDVYFVSGKVPDTVDRLASLFNALVDKREGQAVLQMPAGGRLHVMTASAWKMLVPAAALPPLPAPVGYGVRVGSIEKTRQYLLSMRVPFGVQDSPHQPISLWISPENAFGAAIHFFEEESNA